MKKFFSFTLVLIITLFNCNKSPTGYDGSYYYPLETGLVWNYEQKFQMKNYRPFDLNYPYTPDTGEIVENFRVLSEGKYKFENGVATFILSAIPLNHYYYKSTNYYISKPEKLYRYAYKSYGYEVLPKSSGNLKYLLNGKHFNNIPSIIDYATGIINKFQDSVYIEPTPRLVYKFPLKIGSKWNFVDIDGMLKIDKEVIEKKFINVLAGKFLAFVIKWHYYYNGQQNSINISVLEYLSEKGLLKRTFHIKDVALIESDNPEIKGYIDFIQEINLINFDESYEN